MTRRGYYRFSGRNQRVTIATIRAWRKLAKVAASYRLGDLMAFAELRTAYEAARIIPVIGQDSQTNPCQSLRETARTMIFSPVYFHRPEDLTYYAQKVEELCAAEMSLNAAIKAAG